MGRKNEDIGNRVTLCQDGKYRWVYEVNMLTNYSILFDVVRQVCCQYSASSAICSMLQYPDGNM